MNSKQYYIDNIKTFVNEYFPSSNGILITGSFNTPYFNETSDLDIILISNWHRDSFVESYLYNSLKIQVIVLPLYDIDGIIYRDIARGKGAVISMLAKGLVIQDYNHLLERLKQQCSILYERGPMPIQKEIMDSCRAKITSSIEDIEGTEDLGEQIFSIVEAYNNIVKLFFYKTQLWTYDGKGAAREINFRDKPFHDDYISSLDSYFQSHNKQNILCFLKKTLQKCGGELHFNSTRNFKEVCEGNTLVIHIQPCSKDTEYKDVHTLTENFCSFLYKHIKEVNCFSFIRPSNSLYPAGAYIFIIAEHHSFEEYIIPKIRLFHLKDPISMRSGMLDNWQYPFNINPLETFGTSDVQLKVSNYLCNIHSIYMQNSLDTSPLEDIEKAIYTFQHYKHLAILQSPKNWNRFWNMIFDIYIKTHLNKMLPTSNLKCISEIKKANIINKFESLYKNNSINIALHPEQYNQLLEIEQYYINNKGCLETVPFSGLYASKEEQLFYAFFKLVDMTLDMYSITEKALVSYIVMHK